MTKPLVSTNVGNGFSKAISTARDDNNQPRCIVFPSVGALEQGALDFSTELDRSDNGNRQADLIIEFRGERWALGEAAYQYGRMQVVDMSRSRIETQSYQLLYAATLAATVRNSGLLAVVASLPIRWYTSDREKARAVLSGEFTVRYAGKTRTYTVLPEDCHIIPEGFGALMARLFTSTGKALDPDAARRKWGVIDIGTRTVGFLRVDGLKVIPAESDMTDKLGMSTVWKLLQEDISQMYGRELNERDLDLAYRQRGFSDAGEWVDIGELCDRASDGLASAIMGKVNSLWDNGRATDYLLCTGGGNTVSNFFTYKNLYASQTGWWDNAQGGLNFGIARGFANG
jgi:hypothetical protein